MAVVMGLLMLLVFRYNRAAGPMKRVRMQHPDTVVAFRIQALPAQSSVFGLKLEISGQMDKPVSLVFYEDDGIELFKMNLGEGKIKETISIDWYEPYCNIRFEPSHKKSGDILIKYRFRSLGNN